MEWNFFKSLAFLLGKREQVFYSIDLANNRGVIGWCFDIKHPDVPVYLRFFMDDQEIGGTKAEDFREDVKSYNFHPTGLCGFEFPIPQDVPIRNHHFLNIFAEPYKKPLRRIPTRQIPIVMEGALPKIFFMHIPKTAGTSFNSFCRLHFPSEKIAIQIESLSPSHYSDLFKEKNFLSGHLTFNNLMREPDISGFDLLTLVREPFSHLHSHLKWVRSIASDTSSGFFLKHHSVVQETALKLKRTDFSDKRQLKALVKSMSGIEIDFFDNLQTRYFLDYRPEKVTLDDLNRAKKNLAQFKIIGTTEQYDRFIDRVCMTYRMEKILPPMFNKASGKRLFYLKDPEVRSILYPLMESDLLLYDWISESMHQKKVMS